MATQLDAGRSLEAIAGDVNRSPSTVAYWVRKHGLHSAHAERHASRGTLDRRILAALVDEGLSIAAIAAEVGRSPTSVRHWLGRYGLQTRRGRNLERSASARREGVLEFEGWCELHGLTRFGAREGGFRCARCRSEHVAQRRRRVKYLLVSEAGGACVACGYARSVAALHFHHVDPTTKSFAIAASGMTRSLARAREECAKCVLLCANCHAEVEAGVTQLSFAAVPGLRQKARDRSGVAQSGRAFDC